MLRCSNTHISHSLTDFRAKESRLLAVYTQTGTVNSLFAGAVGGHLVSDLISE